MLRNAIIIAVAALICLAASSVSAQNIVPPGPYNYSCKTKVERTVLTGECTPFNGGFATKTSLIEFYLCDGAIRNDNGKLACNKNPNSELMQKAKLAVRLAYRDATGTALPGSELPWIREFFDTSFNATSAFFDKGGLSRYEIQGVFQKYLCQPNEANLRLETINRAFDETYGKAPAPTDTAYWNSKACDGNGPLFNRIVYAETEKMNQSKVTRRFMITAAYKRSFGRSALSSELDKWTPLKDNFAAIVMANRGYLYSSQGAKELAATVERALYGKKSEKPTAAEISSAIVQYSGNKAIFVEM